MEDFKNRYPRRTACVVFIAFCGACNALLDNHSRELKVGALGAGGKAMIPVGAAGDAGLGGSENSVGEAGASGASGASSECSEGGAAGSENEPVGSQAGS